MILDLHCWLYVVFSFVVVQFDFLLISANVTCFTAGYIERESVWNQLFSNPPITRWSCGSCSRACRLYAVGIRWCFYGINPTVVHSAKPRAWESLWKAHWCPVWWKWHCSTGWSRLRNADREVWTHSRSGLVGGSGMPVIVPNWGQKTWWDKIAQDPRFSRLCQIYQPPVWPSDLPLWAHCLFR